MVTVITSGTLDDNPKNARATEFSNDVTCILISNSTGNERVKTSTPFSKIHKRIRRQQTHCLCLYYLTSTSLSWSRSLWSSSHVVVIIVIIVIITDKQYVVYSSGRPANSRHVYDIRCITQTSPIGHSK